MSNNKNLQFYLFLCHYFKFNTPFTLHSQNWSNLSRTVPSGSVNGHFLSGTVPLWKGKAFDSRTVPEIFRVGECIINPRRACAGGFR